MKTTIWACSVAVAALLAPQLRRGADAAQGRYAQLRGERRAAELRLPREHVVRLRPSGGAALLTLLKFDAANYPKIVGDLAESWEVSPDGLTYTFKIRSGVKFHDGSALSSADVKASYDRIVNPPTGVVSIRQAAYDDVTAIETPDAQTVVFKIKAPDPSLLANLASPWNCIYSAAKLKQDPKFPEKNILGTGPVQVRRARRRLALGRRSATTTISSRGSPISTASAPCSCAGRRSSTPSRAAQVLAEFRGQTPAERDKLKSALGDKITVQELPWVCNLVVGFNTEKKPFDDVRVRRALSLAIDRWQGSEALSKIAIVRGVGATLRPGYDLAASDAELQAMPGFSRDIAKSRAEAKKLLAEAGHPNLKFKFLNRNVPMPYTPVGVFLIDQWRQIGVTVEHEQLETRLYQAALSGGNYEVGARLQLRLHGRAEPAAAQVHLGRQVADQLRPLPGPQDGRALREAEARRRSRSSAPRSCARSRSTCWTWPTRCRRSGGTASSSTTTQLKGWEITPSHYLNQDLADVWLAAN